MELSRCDRYFHAIIGAARRAAPFVLPVLALALDLSFHGVDIFSSWTI
jgi:hypothetical protein